jgi:Zn-dependent protease with chaperone function
MTRILAAIAFAVLSGCSANPITGRSQFLLVSEDMAIGSSSSAYSQMIGQLERKKQIETGTPRAQRVREITDRLIAQAVRFRPDAAKWAWDVKVINDSKVVNAFCMAGGKMGIYTGFWDKLKATDDEIAAVMGHEIGHALASHTRERMSVALGVGVGTAIVAIAASSSSDPRSYGRTLSTLEIASLLAITLPNSRDGELEADQIGIELAARAGYDPRAAVTLWEKMAKEGGGPPEFLSTHPSPGNRTERLKALIPKVDHLYQLARAGKPTEGVPSFLSAPDASNERAVGSVSREAYAARVAREGEAMTFLAEPMERFRRGEAVFTCRIPCALRYSLNKSDWKALHQKQAWRELALSVMQTDYLSDLSYFMLGEAARGMGLADTARKYYRRALEAGKEYGCGGLLDSCEGFEVQKQAAALGR